MISFGVQKEAVIEKIKLDGLDPNKFNIKSNIQKQPPPPPPPIPKIDIGIGISKNLLLDIQKRKKLKKVEIKTNVKKKYEDPRIPSLDQISNALAKLKKINI